MKKTKSKTRTTEQQQRAAEILQFIQNAKERNHKNATRPVKPRSKSKSKLTLFQKFLRSINQL